jgi:hypothetical protein
MNLPKDLKSDIDLYCKLNNIKDYDKFIIKCIRQGFTIEKFGSAPPFKEKKVEVTIKIDEPIISTDKVEKNNMLLNTNSEPHTDLIEKKKNKNKRDLYGE